MQLISDVAGNMTLANQVITYFRKQNYSAALRNLQVLSEHLMYLINSLIQSDALLQSCGYKLDGAHMVSILSMITNAQESQDYILLADLLELQLIPFLLEIQEVLIGSGEFEVEEAIWQQNMQKLQQCDPFLAGKVENCRTSPNCVIEPTSSGLWTLNMTDETGIYYFHSNTNPEVEAEIFAEQYYSIDCERYVVIGLGLGYHVKALTTMDDGIYIDIIEADLNIIRLANTYMDLSWLYDNPRIRLLYDSQYTVLKDLLGQNMELVVHYPSLRHIAVPELKLQVEKFFIQDSGIRNLRIQLMNNFRDNIVHCDGCVDELESEFEGKNAVIVAAGPSLDKNVELLRDKPFGTLIIAVGTVFRKLMHLGIEPDYVVFLDPAPHLYSQIKGLENCKIPILCLSTACKRIMSGYAGKRYLICQKGYSGAEKYAERNHYRLYETGGCVSTIALDLCLQLGCKEIAFAGLDLAFTDNKAHATDTSEVRVDEEEKTVITEAVYGGMVASSKVFTIYREWIERRVKEPDAVGKVIDATEGGALIQGLKIEKLGRVLKRWKESQL